MPDVSLVVRVASHLTARVLRVPNSGGPDVLHVEVHPLDIRANDEAGAGCYVELHPPLAQPDAVADAEATVILHDERFADPAGWRHVGSSCGPDTRSMAGETDSEQGEVRHA